MKFNYKLKRLCGAYYGYQSSNTNVSLDATAKGANIVFDRNGDRIITAVYNRVQVVDLKSQAVRTLPVEARSNIRVLCASPDDRLLVVVDVQGYALLIHLHRGVVLHRWRFAQPVRQVCFSPNGHYFAVTHGKQVQVWQAPSTAMAGGGGGGGRQFCPLVRHRVYTGQSDDTTSLTWSQDGTVLAAGSRDGTVRIWTTHTTRNFVPVTLASHKRPLVGVYLVQNSDDGALKCYSISQDGALVTWTCQTENGSIHVKGGGGGGDTDDNEMTEDAAAAGDFFTDGTHPETRKRPRDDDNKMDDAHRLVGGRWTVANRHYFHQDGATVTATSYCENEQLLAVGFSSGLFGLYEMPAVANIHTLSVGTNQLIQTCVLNQAGDWLALGCPKSQQLLVWEWRSETYVLQQRGHAAGMMRCMAYSPDGIVIATGGEDGKIKVWNATSGFCYVTLPPSHTAPVTAICFAKASVVMSASLDGTVRAHDLYRYRTFRTLTTPTPVQFLSLAVDPSGEVVVAGSTDPFHVYAWNLQTGKILDVFTGHSGPVCNLHFQSSGGMLASASWDGTVKLWDLYKGNVPTESLRHNSDVVCVSFRPDGKELCSGTIGGLLNFWDVETGKLKFEIDGRRDIAGGRKINDRVTSDNNAASRYFTSVCYSADGSCVLAGGNSKYVCIYEVSQQILLKKFQVTFNRSLDGVLDELNSKNMGSSGPVDDDANDSGDETTYNAVALPGAKRGDDGSRRSKVEVLTSQVAFSSTGREWAAVSGEGLHVYSLDDDMMFDPIALTEDVTPAAVEHHVQLGSYGNALTMALHLNEFGLVHDVVDRTPYDSIPHVVRSVGAQQLERLMQCVANIVAVSPHVEFYVEWCLQILHTHGLMMERNRATYMRAFRAMQKSIQIRHDELQHMSNENGYMLDYLRDHATAAIKTGEDDASDT